MYELTYKFSNSSISTEELLAELRGGDIQDLAGAFGIIIAIIILANNVNGFQPIRPPHRQLFEDTSNLQINRPSESCYTIWSSGI